MVDRSPHLSSCMMVFFISLWIISNFEKFSSAVVINRVECSGFMALTRKIRIHSVTRATGSASAPSFELRDIKFLI
jgi:hypothetical protein